jgi:hypothetical protein
MGQRWAQRCHLFSAEISGRDEIQRQRSEGKRISHLCLLFSGISAEMRQRAEMRFKGRDQRRDALACASHPEICRDEMPKASHPEICRDGDEGSGFLISDF